MIFVDLVIRIIYNYVLNNWQKGVKTEPHFLVGVME